jgi:hypothetical protein
LLRTRNTKGEDEDEELLLLQQLHGATEVAGKAPGNLFFYQA